MNWQALAYRRTRSRPSRSSTCPSSAAGLGACVVEKHSTPDRRLPGPDHASAVEPGELGELVRQIREVEAALGDGLKLGPAPEEEEMPQKARRSLIAARAIPKGAR